MSSLVSARDVSVAGKITRSGLETRRSRPPASMIVASEVAMAGSFVVTVVLTFASRESHRRCHHAGVASLTARERAALPDSAFAYIDSKGARRLPIHDAAHVRNALARFSQVAFEDDDARDRARIRLLRAAQKHGIMPIGFLSAQLQPQRRLPSGQVTLLLADLEGSTELLGRLHDGYAPVLKDIRRRDPAGDAGAHLAGRQRRAVADRPAPRASDAHRDRVRRRLRPCHRAHR